MTDCDGEDESAISLSDAPARLKITVNRRNGTGNMSSRESA